MTDNKSFRGILGKNKDFFNIFWAVSSKLMSGVKLVVIGIIIARFLGPDKFGLYSYVISFVTLLSVLAEFRLQNILVRELSEDRKGAETLLGSAWVTCIFFAVTGYIILLVLTVGLESNHNLRFYIYIYGISYLFQTIRFLRAFFISKYLNGIIFKVEFLVGTLILIGAILLGLFGGNVMSFIILRLADFLLISLFLILFYRIRFSKLNHWRLDLEVAKSLVKLSSPLVLSSFAMIIFQQLDKIMIKYFLDEYAVGQYSAASSLISLIVFVPVVLTEVISPYLISIKLKEGMEQYKKKAQLFSDIIFWGSMVISLVVALLSNFIINIIYGNRFTEAIEVMRIFSWQGVFVAMGAIAAQIMIIDNKHQIAYVKSLSGGLINIVLNLFWIPQYGIMGAVWASLVAYAISSYGSHFFIKRYRYIFYLQTNSIARGIVNIYNEYKK